VFSSRDKINPSSSSPWEHRSSSSAPCAVRMRLSKIGQHIQDEPCAKQQALLGVFSSRSSSVSRGVRSAGQFFFSPLVYMFARVRARACAYVRACARVHVRACVRVRMCVGACVWAARARACMRAYELCVRACVRACVKVHACVRACVRACARACVRVRVRASARARAHVHVYACASLV
jgi:hypothetical protein